jgi:hypothetical protein
MNALYEARQYGRLDGVDRNGAELHTEQTQLFGVVERK